MVNIVTAKRCCLVAPDLAVPQQYLSFRLLLADGVDVDGGDGGGR